MGKKKISPKVQKATEKYLASLGSSRAELTDEQWEIVIKHIKKQHQAKWILLFSIFMSICITYTALLLYFARDMIINLTPTTIVYTDQAGSGSITEQEPEGTKTYTNLLFLLDFAFTFHICVGIFILARGVRSLVENRKNEKMLNEFIPTAQSSTNSTAEILTE